MERPHQTPPRTLRLTLPELSLVIGLALVFAALQSAYLHTTLLASTDEGVNAEAGRRMVAGEIPHRDFYLAHMPLFSLLVGVGLSVSGSMYYVRLASVLINCLAVLPLYVALRRLAPEWRHGRYAALAAVVFYLTYHEMVHHDYRSIALRPLVNLGVLSYLALGTARTSAPWIAVLQAALSIFVTFLFLPALANLALISAALILSTPRWARRRVAGRYVAIGLLVVISVALYFWLIPDSFKQVILDQLRRPPTPRLWRWIYMLEQRPDRVLYVLSTASLIVATIVIRDLRVWSAAMLGIIGAAILLPSNFMLHYPTVAAPAFAFGVFTFGYVVALAVRPLARPAAPVVLAALGLAVGVHLALTLPSLLQEWTVHNPHQRQIVERLQVAPDPLLALTPIYAVEGGKQLVRELAGAYMDPPGGRQVFDAHQYRSFGMKACSILLESGATRVVPAEVVDEWRRHFRLFYENPIGTILLTDRPHCAARPQ